MHEREHRQQVDVAVRVWREDKAYRANALNVSAGGATLADVGPVPLNAWVTLSLLHRNIRARVAWVAGHEIGVSFLTRLTPAQLKDIRHALGQGLDTPARNAGD